MQKVYLLFDYFKRAFKINKENKLLYKPQIILIAIKALFIIMMSVMIYYWLDSNEIKKVLSTGLFMHINVMTAVTFVISIGSIIFTYTLLSRIVEAGLYNMYKSCILVGEVSRGDFWQGVNKYFFKFLFGDLLIVLAWIPFSVFYFIAGIVTLTIGFAIIPMLVGIFIAVWKISLVMNDTNIISAFNNSFKFAREHFVPLAFFKLIHWSFSNIGTNTPKGHGNIDKMFKWSNSGQEANRINGKDLLKGLFSEEYKNDNLFKDFNYFDTSNIIKVLNNIIEVLKNWIAVIVSVISISIIIVSIIKMIFDVFFSLAAFVIYNEGFREINQPQESEVHV